MNKKILIASATALTVVMLIIIIAVFSGSDKTGNSVTTTLYYINSEETSIDQQTVTLYYNDKDDLVHKIFEELKKGTYNKTVPDNTSINSIRRNDDNTMVIDMTSHFLTNNIDYNTLRLYAFIKSICSAGNVVDVSGAKVTVNGSDVISVDGEPIGYLYAGEVNLSSDKKEISDDVVALYHLTKNNTLVKQTYTVAVSGKLNTEMFILESLAEQPANEHLKHSYENKDGIISAETRNNICFVNLKKSFVSANTGSDKDENVLYSMVNSLTSLDDVNGVVILIEGKRTDKFGTIDTTDILKANYSMVE